MLSRTLDVLQSLLIPSWHQYGIPEPSRHSRRVGKKCKVSTMSLVEPLLLHPKTSLEHLNADVFRLITDQLEQQEVSLSSLASSSRSLRSLAIPRLFARCRADNTKPALEDLPEAIRHCVRHLTQCGPLNQEGEGEDGWAVE
ncbi:hypothetical protein V8D89_004733 [Ganoderma adspersum]